MPLSRKASQLLKTLRGRKKEHVEQADSHALTVLANTSRSCEARALGASKSGYSRQAAVGTLATPSAASNTGKRNRTSMGHNAILIHEDKDAQARPAQKLRKLETQRRVIHVPDEEDEQGTSSEDSIEAGEDVDVSVADDMRKLEESFQGISQRYRLINRIGEGTFSTVYKAEELGLDDEDVENESTHERDHFDKHMPPIKRLKASSAPAITMQSSKAARTTGRIVALKKIYVTSSPHRIANELELLYLLRDAPYICPLLNAFRHLDQVVAVLPYFRHLDFRFYYRDFMVSDMRHYFSCLFHALHYVHKAGILHRDVKPTNFLYDHESRKGVLVDFGLAEKQGTDWQPCLCLEHAQRRHDRYMNSFAIDTLRELPGHSSSSYPNPKADLRSMRRANRAGTRGFRAPEVLLKCTAQTTKIDIWSAGVILLTLLTRRFPFFNSADDVDAMIEIASIFGKRRMKIVAALHGSVFETNLNTIGEMGYPLERIVQWAGCIEESDAPLRAGEIQAIRLLDNLLELDPNKRFSAKQALQHEFFTAAVEDKQERAERERRDAQEEQETMKQR